jgi:O-antigen ligase
MQPQNAVDSHPMTEITTSGRRPSLLRWPSSTTIGANVRRVCAWSFAFALSVYLGLSGGGYDIAVRSEIGLLVWWFVLLGVLVGALPYARVPRAGWIAALLLGGFLVWTWIGIAWSSSHELTLAEVCRLSTYLGIFLLGLCVVSDNSARSLIHGLGCGIAVVCGIAILSKLAPSLFPADTAKSFYATARLSYPFDYADGVGEYAAIGAVLVLYMATGARTLAGRALACAATLPVLLCVAMTVSRGGILAALVGTVAFLALVPNRIPRLPTFGIVAAGVTVLMVALLHRPALRDSVAAAPAAQRHSMLVLICAVMAGCAVAQGALLLLMRRIPRPGWLYVSQRSARALTTAIIAAGLAVVVLVLADGTVSRLWHDFKLWEPTTHSNQYFRLLSLAGSHRYQYWQVALNAFSSSPFHGIGAGTFRYYWEQHTTHAEYIVNAHSLWIETLAETGIVGGVLLVGFFALISIGGAVRALRTRGEQGTLIAAAAAGVLAFCAAASFDWIWQIGVVPMVALLLAGITLLPTPHRTLPKPAGSALRAPWTRRGAVATRALGGLGAVLAMILIAIPLASTVELRASQAAYRAGRLSASLADANTATAIEPGAASPYLQRAEIFEAADHIGQASQQIAAAIARSPHNYELWLIASRFATEADHPRQALADYRRAKALYPTSLEFLG